jgi:hypothetical protein
MIKILTGWSNPGGSTTAHINLCKLFNANGMPCGLWGPHEWHLNKVPGGLLKDVHTSETDTLIYHFLESPIKPKVHKLIYSCHETNIKPIRSFDYTMFDTIHFVSEGQRKWHNINCNSVVIPNVLDDLVPNPKGKEVIAGVIGSIDCHKQSHLSVQRALEDGYPQIVLCGALSDPYYWEERIKPLVDKHPGRIFHIGYRENKQKMYDCFHEVYHSSLRETYNLVKAECILTNTKYNGLATADTDGEVWNNQDILNAWKKIL